MGVNAVFATQKPPHPVEVRPYGNVGTISDASWAFDLKGSVKREKGIIAR